MFDIHSHILPGIDDGSKSFKESLDILRGLSEQGITDVICTPHYIAETKQTSTKTANTKLMRELQKRAKAEKINVKLYIGNEIYIDHGIEKFLKAKKIAPLGNKKCLLVELPMSGEFEQYEDIMLELQQKGWKIILAHPERYHSFQKDYEKVLEMLRQGVQLQCNLGSFIGQYGRHAKKLAKKLAKNHKIFCVATDIHHRRDYSEISKARKKLAKYYSDNELHTILVDNPREIVK